MKQGKSISALAGELSRQSAVKHDFLADTRQLTLTDDSRLSLAGQPSDARGMSDLAHRQVA